MHKLECSAMCSYGENWCPSETVRLVARIILKQVRTTRFFGNFLFSALKEKFILLLNVIFYFELAILLVTFSRFFFYVYLDFIFISVLVFQHF